MEAGTGEAEGPQRAVRLRSKAAGGHFTSGAVQGPPRPQPSAVIPPPSRPLGGPLSAASRSRRPRATGQGRTGAGTPPPAAPAAGTRALGAVRRGRGRMRPWGRSVGGSPTAGRGGRGKREKAGSRYLYWAAAAAAAAPLWVNPK